MTAYPNLFAPLQVGNLRLRNRLAMSAMGVAIIDDDGILRERAIRYYEERARGGVGLIITEPCAIAYPRGAQSRRQPALSSDDCIPGLRELADRVHRHGAAIAVQLLHHGKVSRLDTREGRPLLMPSIPEFHGAMDMANDLTGEELDLLIQSSKGRPSVHVATAADIAALVDDFAAAARRAAAAGCDAIEIHAAHGYVISEFLSPAWNRREDEYGGSRENRARLLCAVLRGVKRRLADDGSTIPVWCRIDAVELRTPGGIALEDAQRTAELAVDAGADAIHVSAYADATSGPAFTEAPLTHREAGYADHAAAIKSRVSVPVIAVGRIEPAVGDGLIGDGKADVIAMARKLLADPDVADKLRDGREDDIRPCIYCYRCVAQPFFDRTVLCGVNPAMGHESQLADAERGAASEARRVLVLGGGPAGLEAAIVAARRGHRVTLVEKSDELGGRLRYAAALYEPNARLLRWLIRQVEAAAVEVRLGVAADAELVADSGAEIVLAAVGAEAATAVPAAAINAYDFATVVGRDGRPGPAIGRRVVVLGGGQVAIRIADFLSRHDREVSVAADGDTLAPEMAHPLRWRVLADLRERGARLFRGATSFEIGEAVVHFEERRRDGTTEARQLGADTVIILPGLAAKRSLADELSAAGVDVRPIGDTASVGTLESAIATGFRAAIEI